ncbi:MAG: AMP-dependent synthetase/ligase [candidate division Zixibacteria bacterium]|nr:AMP-dependent synthetase/ligase [candidate division Zixibacteria bacterium]MDH3938578.1 AMP-dependent synthetase/ligase [candidate division Zixibacteria bacterium]MDH4034801.1 AMP-dependent synthetase/ligase [candidate division Zixibacteria bacterium]
MNASHRDNAPPPNLCSRFEQSSQRLPDQIAFKSDGGQGRSYPYSEVGRTVRRMAAGLKAGNHIDGQGVGLLSENRPEWGIAYLSILAAGGTVVPIDINLKPTEVAYLLGHAAMRSIFVSKRGSQLMSDTDVSIEHFDFDSDGADNWMRLTADEPLKTLPPAAETAVIIYTSGTTGTPKAVELTHKNLVANLDGIVEALEFGPGDVFLSVLPLHHTFEATCGFLTPLMSGATIVYARSLKSGQIVEDIAHNRVTILVGVPLLFEKMHQSFERKLATAPTMRRLLFRSLMSVSALGWRLGGKWGRALFRSVRNRAGLGSVRMFVSGGAALSPRIARFFNLLGFDCMQGYGMTECSPVVSAHRPDDIRFGSVGPPIPNVQVAIDSPDEEGIGEIVVKGENVTPGYRGLPKETADLIIDGWLHTGDLGRLHRGHLWITGRCKSLIVSAAGKNIYPEEIEEKLTTSPHILEAVVFGRISEGKQREEVMALIVPDLEWLLEAGLIENITQPDQQRLHQVVADAVALVNEQVAAYKRIASFDIRLEELEKTSTRKIKRFLYK